MLTNLAQMKEVNVNRPLCLVAGHTRQDCVEDQRPGSAVFLSQVVACFKWNHSCISVYFCTLCMQLLLIITQEANLYENLICLYKPEIFNQIKKCFNYTRRYLRTYVPSFHIEKKEKGNQKLVGLLFSPLILKSSK